MIFSRIYLVIFFGIVLFKGNAQDSINYRRLTPLVISATTVYAGSMIALNEIWYKEDDRTSFRFFNDNAEWKQVDKAGHFYAGYHLAKFSYDGLVWSGVSKKKAGLISSVASVAMLLPIEYFDGRSAGYGASTGDIVADVAGSALFLIQQRLWDEPVITPKFSFHRTPYAPLRPELLGDGLHQEWIKDYNGQTYWLSFDTYRIFKSQKKWLDFVNIAIGYGAEGMVHARDENNIQAGFTSYRQFYLAPDIDLTAIETNSKFLKTVFSILNIIHLPSPALSFGNKEIKFEMFYF